MYYEYANNVTNMRIALYSIHVLAFGSPQCDAMSVRSHALNKETMFMQITL